MLYLIWLCKVKQFDLPWLCFFLFVSQQKNHMCTLDVQLWHLKYMQVLQGLNEVSLTIWTVLITYLSPVNETNSCVWGLVAGLALSDSVVPWAPSAVCWLCKQQEEINSSSSLCNRWISAVHSFDHSYFSTSFVM